ncbi:MAG: Gfo/Idh/MocA family oxidoreductase, partial [Planctomycetales bacterium]
MPAALQIPEITYLPCDPTDRKTKIGLIGCGSITRDHLTAYRSAGYNVVALCDLQLQAAQRRSDEFFPDADVYDDPRKLLNRDDIAVVDIATHPEVRAQIIEDALKAGKHVLSQKPFVLDLDVGQRLIKVADQQGRKLAVNQNGRWAPHFSYIRNAIDQGVIGQVQSVQMAVHWDHNWIAGTEFDNVKHVILYDFAIHWFDILCCFMGNRQPKSVFASSTRSKTQAARPALMGQAMVQYEDAQASLVFNGDTRCGAFDTTVVVGTHGTISSIGPDLSSQQVTLAINDQRICPELAGRWFPDGFHGTMGELLRAIEEDRQPDHAAENNLQSLSLCFAAVASAE